MGRACTIIRQRVVGGMAQLAWRKPKCRTFMTAVREHVLEEPAEKLYGVKGGSAWACTSRLTGGEGDGVVFEAHDALVGEGHFADRGGEGGEGRVTVGIGLDYGRSKERSRPVGRCAPGVRRGACLL